MCYALVDWQDRDVGGMPSRMSPSISLELGSSLDESQLLRDKISRLQQDREHLSAQLSHYREQAETAQTDLAAERVSTDSHKHEVKTPTPHHDQGSSRNLLQDLQEPGLSGCLQNLARILIASKDPARIQGF